MFPTFAAYLAAQLDRDDAVGALARDWAHGRTGPRFLRYRLDYHGAAADVLAAVDVAEQEWKNQLPR